MKKTLSILTLSLVIVLIGFGFKGQAACFSPLDYDNDGQVGLTDAVAFTEAYFGQNQKANINGDKKVDRRDYWCAAKYIARGDNSCSLDCLGTNRGNAAYHMPSQ